jgi:hypothetical protein
MTVQDQMAMNAWVLSNLVAHFCYNEQKAIAKVKGHVTLEWGRLQGDLQYTLDVLKPILVKLTFSHIL